MGFFSFIGQVFTAIKNTFFPSEDRHASIVQYPSIDQRSYSNSYSNDYSSYYWNTCYHPPVPSSTRVSPVYPKPVSFLQLKQLKEYPLPNWILAIERGDDEPDNKFPQIIANYLSLWNTGKNCLETGTDLYRGLFELMAFFEEAVETLAIRKYNLEVITLTRVTKKEFYFTVPPKADEFFAAIDDELLDRFTLLSKSSSEKLNGKIKRRVSERIYVDIYPGWKCNSNETYSISFEIHRTIFQLQHNALRFINEHGLFSILINNPLYHTQDPIMLPTNHSVTNQSGLNDEQNQAIEYIVNGKYNPLPYLLYGRPGTGKTKTVVAAIEKIVRTTTKNVLVCAQSNFACNEIAVRLCKLLSKTELLRMFSMSYNHEKISETIEPFCNLYNGELKYPSLDYLYKFRVLVCTLSTAGCLVRARNNSLHNNSHFGYIFIDECASAQETMSLIPIAGVCTSHRKVHANIVLIGDPKQLDAVTKSMWSIKMGSQISLFERLFNLPLYKRNAQTGQFSQQYITQLVQNYRSHRAILKIPNELFYENTLQAMASPEIIQLKVEGLLSKKFPIIFKSVHGKCQRPIHETSSFNMDEVNAVMEFVKMLLNLDKATVTQSDIGIVSPYNLQCKKLKQNCKKNGYDDIVIGSAEVFQGQEKSVMIVSTVRSGKKFLGDFLSNAQRFNVMITRAKNLLIVVGDPHLLSNDSNWCSFIEFCFKKRCLLQGTRYFRPQKTTKLANKIAEIN